MLTVSRRSGESVVLFDSHSDEVVIVVGQIQRSAVLLSVEYPDDLSRRAQDHRLEVGQQLTLRMTDGEPVAIRNQGAAPGKPEVSLRFDAKRCVDIFRAELVSPGV